MNPLCLLTILWTIIVPKPDSSVDFVEKNGSIILD